MTLTTPARSGFVSTLAWVSLALGVVGVLGNALPWRPPPPQALAEPLPAGLAALLAWLYTHRLALALAGAVPSAVLAGVAWGLLRRREWARRGFIVVLALTALANFACLPLLDSLATMLFAAFAPPDLEQSQWLALTQTLQRMLFWACLSSALLVAALHGAIAWKLCRPGIRAEFRPDGS